MHLGFDSIKQWMLMAIIIIENIPRRHYTDNQLSQDFVLASKKSVISLNFNATRERLICLKFSWPEIIRVNFFCLFIQKRPNQL